jgi:hypothetical protein
MLGEVGLDGGARMRWPWSGRGRHPDFACSSVAEGLQEEEEAEDIMEITQVDEFGLEERGRSVVGQFEEMKEGNWNRLTPFKVSMIHQRGIVEAQMDVAVELGVNISFHSVAAAGEWDRSTTFNFKAFHL